MMAREVTMERISELLEAGANNGCLFCGYNGEGYWQHHTHTRNCPWYEIGGFQERAEALPEVIKTLATYVMRSSRIALSVPAQEARPPVFVID